MATGQDSARLSQYQVRGKLPTLRDTNDEITEKSYFRVPRVRYNGFRAIIIIVRTCILRRAGLSEKMSYVHGNTNYRATHTERRQTVLNFPNEFRK